MSKPNVIEGQLVATGLKFAVVVSRWNDFIGDKLLAGALDTIKRHGGDLEQVDVMWVPGAFEIPMIALEAASSGRYDAVICLGLVIRGATAHFDFVAGQNAAGIAKINMETGVPTIYGVLTTENIDQAIERAGTKAGNKGIEAAASAIEMANLLKALKARTEGDH